MVFEKGTKVMQWGKDDLCNKWYPMQRENLDTDSIATTKITPNGFISNCSMENHEDSTGENPDIEHTSMTHDKLTSFK